MLISPQRTPVPASILNPLAIKRDPKLSVTARMLYTLLLDTANERGEVQLHSAVLAGWLGRTEDAVGRAVTELRAAGVLTTQRRGRNHPLHYTLLAIGGAIMLSAASVSSASAAAPRQMELVQSRNLGISVTPNDEEEPAFGDGPDDDDAAEMPPQHDAAFSSSHRCAATPLPSPATPPHTPVRDIYNQPAAAAVRAHASDELLLLGFLKNYGIDDACAAQLLSRFGADRCRLQVRAMPHHLAAKKAVGDPIQSPARWLRRLIERNAELPGTLVDELRRELHAVDTTPPRENHVDRETREIAEQLDDAAIDAILDALPTHVAVEVDRIAAAEVEGNFAWRRGGDAVRRTIMRAAKVRTARALGATSR